MSDAETFTNAIDPQSARFLRFFQFAHLAPDLAAASAPFCHVAQEMAETIPAGPEETAGMRKLLEAKDCFVRAVLEARK